MRVIYLLFLLFLSLVALAQPSGDSLEPIFSSGSSTDIYSENDKMGLQKANEKPITAAVYDTLYAAGTTRYVAQRYNRNKEQALWGIIDDKGQTILALKYRKLKVVGTLVIVGLQEQNRIIYGVFSLIGNELISPKFASIEILNDHYIAINEDKNVLLFNHSGEKISQLQIDSLTLLNNDYAKYFVNGKAGILHLPDAIKQEAIYADIKIDNNEFLVKQLPTWTIYRNLDTLVYQYENIIEWDNNLIVTNRNRSWVIDKNNKKLSGIYDSIHSVNADLALVKKDDKWGVIDHYGSEIISVQYQKIISDDEMLYTKTKGKGEKWKIFDHYGYQKTKHVYDSILPISQGRIGIKRNNKWGFLDRFGVEIITPIYDAVQPFRDDLSIVTFFREDGIINRQGKWVVTPIKMEIIDYGNKTFLGKIYGRYQIRTLPESELVYFTGNRLSMYSGGFIESDSLAKVIRYISWNGTFEVKDAFGEDRMTGGGGLIIFKNHNRYGFKDQQGRIVIANRYNAVKPFHQKLAAVKINSKWGFINLDEKIIVQPQFDSVGNYRDNLCIVRKNGLLGVVNRKGRAIVPTQYEKIELLGNGTLRVQKNGNWGILNDNGAVVIHPKYRKLIPINEKLFIVQRNNKYGTINSTGVSIMPLVYGFIGYAEKSNILITKRSQKKEWTFLRKVHSSTI